MRPDNGGSRFIYDSFDAAQARIDANERVMAERLSALDYRLGLIDAALERLENAACGSACMAWRGSYSPKGVRP